MDKFYKLFISFSLMLVLISLFTFSSFGNKYSANYLDSTSFNEKLIEFKSKLSHFELNRLNKEEALKQLDVTDDEIHSYRYSYGTLSEQVSNIHMQYETDLQDAKEMKAVELYKRLKKERDTKVKDITKNFEDNDYVKEKILKDKKKELNKYYKELESHIATMKSEYPYFSYELKNVKTGKVYKGGDLENANYFRVDYTSKGNSAFKDTRPLTELTYAIPNSDGDQTAFENIEIPLTKDEYTGTISISDEAAVGSEIEKMVMKYDIIHNVLLIIWIVSIICLFISLILIWSKRKIYKKINIAIEFQLFFVVILGIVGLGASVEIINGIRNFRDYADIMEFIYYSYAFLLLPIVLWVVCAWFISFVMSIILTAQDLHDAWEHSLLKKIKAVAESLMKVTPLVLKIMAYLVVVFLAGFGFCVMLLNSFEGIIVIIYLILFILFVIPTSWYFFKNAADLSAIMRSSENFVKNKKKTEITVSKRSSFKQHADDVNQMQSGVVTSQFEQNKSERLKTELITNVSHDLRTPLTSIITYTELLKKEGISDEEKLQYVDVLDKKSQRLKTLIDDLFEVSKMSTGNIDLHRQDVDLGQLVQQAVGEHEGDIEKSNLRFNVKVPETPVTVLIDGQRYWRVIDNLVGNAIKYAMEGTRVFVTLEETAVSTELVIKNISKYEISEDVDELYERFKRADASRHTEGSGLGLAIAQSIVELHGGYMRIEIDGDLFKVTVTQPKN